jgi:hypothetical protein
MARGTGSSSPLPSSRQSVSLRISPASQERRGFSAMLAAVRGGSVGRDAQSAATSRRGRVVSLSNDIPVPRCCRTADIRLATRGQSRFLARTAGDASRMAGRRQPGRRSLKSVSGTGFLKVPLSIICYGKIGRGYHCSRVITAGCGIGMPSRISRRGGKSRSISSAAIRPQRPASRGVA